LTEGEPFSQPTAKGGVVKCAVTRDCHIFVELEGNRCPVCRRNHYTPDRDSPQTPDMYVSISRQGEVTVDYIDGVCEMGTIRVVLGPNWRGTKVFINDVENTDCQGIQLIAAPMMMTTMTLSFTKPVERR
jgi:hypothetical protein